MVYLLVREITHSYNIDLELLGVYSSRESAENESVNFPDSRIVDISIDTYQPIILCSFSMFGA